MSVRIEVIAQKGILRVREALNITETAMTAKLTFHFRRHRQWLT